MSYKKHAPSIADMKSADHPTTVLDAPLEVPVGAAAPEPLFDALGLPAPEPEPEFDGLGVMLAAEPDALADGLPEAAAPESGTVMVMGAASIVCVLVAVVTIEPDSSATAATITQVAVGSAPHPQLCV